MATRIGILICLTVLTTACTDSNPRHEASDDIIVFPDAGGDGVGDLEFSDLAPPQDTGEELDTQSEVDDAEPDDSGSIEDAQLDTTPPEDAPIDSEDTSDPDMGDIEVSTDSNEMDSGSDDPGSDTEVPIDIPDVPDLPDDTGDEPDISPCADVICGTNAFCSAGNCFCNRAHQGDPYTECTPRCSILGCGDHATCQDDDNCACDPGYSGDPIAGCSLADPCKTAPVDGSVAQLIHRGGGMLVRPTTGMFDYIAPINPPDDCHGGLIDIVILGEGYTDVDLERFEQDAQIWLDDFLVQRPYSRYLGAFNVWAVPLASAGHIEIGANSASQTRYRLALNSSGSGIQLPSTSSDEWDELEEAVFDALGHVSRNTVHRYPNDGDKHDDLAIQTVVVMLVLKPTCGGYDDPSVACDSYSGFARNLVNPRSNEEVRIAIARNRLHEFGHAFGLLADEYRADDFQDKCLSSSYANGYHPGTWDIRTVNNYAYASYGTELPWQHLLYGAGINGQSGLIGAYEGANTCWEGAWRSEYRCLMNGRHGNSDSCHPTGGVNLRQTDFCNWCEELISMRIYEKVGWLDDDDPWADWVDNWRPAYWSKRDIQLPNNGLPIEDSCDVAKVFEPPPTGVPCEGHSDTECEDADIAPRCDWSTSRDFSYCTRPCTDASDCEDLFNNGCCSTSDRGTLCRPAVDPLCMDECLDADGNADADMCDDHVPDTSWCGYSSSADIYYCTHRCDSYQADCLDLFPGGAEWGCCASGAAGTSLCRPWYSPKCD